MQPSDGSTVKSDDATVWLLQQASECQGRPGDEHLSHHWRNSMLVVCRAS